MQYDRVISRLPLGRGKVLETLRLAPTRVGQCLEKVTSEAASAARKGATAARDVIQGKASRDGVRVLNHLPKAAIVVTGW